MNTFDKPYRSFTVVVDERGVATVAVNVPGRPMNILDREVMLELESIVERLSESTDVKLVLFRSNKESGFLAGADVGAIAEIQTQVEAAGLIEAGQLLFHRIESLPMPTVVAIDGPCLGGGLEWSLACNHRVARDSSSTKIGLPEIKLGLIPGWGGTQRLPKRVGLTSAIKMILQGTHLGAKKAAVIGLIDRAITPDRWEAGIATFIDDVLQGRPVGKAGRFHQLRKRVEMTSPIRSFILSATNRKIASKASSYPALPAAIRAIAAGCDGSPDGYHIERDEFAKLIKTPTCQNLLSLFFSRERARSLKTWTDPSATALLHAPPIQKVGVIGGGAMGAGIGQFAAARGFDVTIREINSDAARAAKDRVETLVDRLARKKSMAPAERLKLEDRIRVTTDQQILRDSDLVIEAIVEREDVKRTVFADLDGLVSATTILATNTSSLSVSRIAAATDRVEKVAGLHFFNPVHRMELVEVVRGEFTDDETVAALVQFVRALGKTPIVTADAPGFLVNRVLFPYLGEAVLAHAEGSTVAGIDSAARHFGMPMGPLELLDQVGLDVASHVSRSLLGVLPDVDAVANALQRMVDEGRLGKKSGEGFYRYRRGRLVRTDKGRQSPADREQLQRRLIYPMLAEAVRCQEQKIVEEAWAIDLAMVLGTGFAPHRGGPLRTIDAIGRQTFVEQMRKLQIEYGDRFAVPTSLVDQIKQEPTSHTQI